MDSAGEQAQLVCRVRRARKAWMLSTEKFKLLGMKRRLREESITPAMPMNALAREAGQSQHRLRPWRLSVSKRE